jgi:hypothetical protein
MGRLGIAVALAVSLFALTAAGCGGSSSDGPSEAQLEAAKQEGEETAHERDRIDSLQKQVNKLKRQAKRGEPASAGHAGAQSVVVPDSESATVRIFHAPSGNVSCEISAHGALCSVGSTAETFSFNNGEPAEITPGTALADGAGELASYGTVVSSGSTTCTVPESDEPHGIICEDRDSGHGFEASRVSSRQRAF